MKKIDCLTLLAYINDFESIILDLLLTKPKSEVSKGIKHIVLSYSGDFIKDLLMGSINKSLLESHITSIPNVRPTFNDLSHFMTDLYIKVSKQFQAIYFNVYSQNGIYVCPYCNHSSLNIKSELDHFIDKGTNPHLAISIQNLVLCCHECNGPKGKHTKPIPYSPYNDDVYNKFSFVLFNEDCEKLWSTFNSENNYSIRYKLSNLSDLNTSKQIENLNLLELYSTDSSVRYDIQNTICEINSTRSFNLSLINKYLYSPLLGSRLTNGRLAKNKEKILKINMIPHSKLIIDIKETLDP